MWLFSKLSQMNVASWSILQWGSLTPLPPVQWLVGAKNSRAKQCFYLVPHSFEKVCFTPHCGLFPSDSFQMEVLKFSKTPKKSWKVGETCYVMHINDAGTYCASFYQVEKVHQRALWAKYDRKTNKIVDISTSCSPPGYPLVTGGREGPTELKFKGFGCDHEV